LLHIEIPTATTLLLWKQARQEEIERLI
jgi:hypothetical protein